MKTETVERATRMLAALLEGRETYRQAAQRFGVGSTTVERQVKALLRHVAHAHAIPGIEDPAFATLQRLRKRCEEVMAAVRDFDPAQAATRRPEPHAIDAHEWSAGLARLKRLSDNALRDVALIHLLFSTGAKPLEIARLQVNDYLAADGSVRIASELLPHAASRGRRRPLYFASASAREALEAYLQHRLQRGLGVSSRADYRGLDPESRLILTEDGRPFAVRSRGPDDPRPRCPGLEAIFHSIFVRADWAGVTTQAVRSLVAHRLVKRGADKKQVGRLLGLSHPRSVRRLLEQHQQPLEALVKDLT